MKIGEFEILHFNELNSTNDKAIELSSQNKGQKLVVWAERQTAGRGRLGRVWQSLDGNLFFSLLLEFELKNLGQLVVISALSVLQTIKNFAPEANVQIKWPNDALLNGKKFCGMLLEKGNGNYMIVGIGLNVAKAPENAGLIYEATSLYEAKIEISPEEFLRQFLLVFMRNMQYLQENGFANLRQKWLKNAKGVGEKIVVKQDNKELNGIFETIDENANLILQNEDKRQKILAGDVFFEEVKR